MLPPTPLPVGGGWSQGVMGSLQVTHSSSKRSSDGSVLSEGSSKRQRMQAAEDDTATESETDDELARVVDESAREAADCIMLACPNCNPDGRIPPPLHGTHPPPPSRDATPSTVLDSQPSNVSSLSLGDPIPPRVDSQSDCPSAPALPSLMTTLHGPVHARLHTKLLKRHLNNTDREAETIQSGLSYISPSSTQRATHGSLCGSLSNPQTYSGPRSHLPSEPESTITEPADTNNIADNLIQPNSPDLTPSQLIRRERARAVTAKAHAEMVEIAPRRHPLFATASQPPASRSQPRPAVGGRGNSIGQRMGGPRRMDPISAACADMVAFNRAVAYGEATSFIVSVTRQSERTAQCSPPLSRPSDELLEDDEEMLAQAEAYAKSKWPVS
jgi:hypothetical protein